MDSFNHENIIRSRFDDYLAHKNRMYKAAADSVKANKGLDFQNGVIPAIESAFTDPDEKAICYMIATSHEYRRPNTANSIAFVKNYGWFKEPVRLSMLEGVDKPVNDKKVMDMAMSGKPLKPVIVVNQLHGIRPQTRGKILLFDGHHRAEAAKARGETTIMAYRGIFNGGDSTYLRKILPKFPSNRRLSFAFDFDGTICGEDGNVSEKVVKAMRALKEKGHLVLIWTCRSGKLLAEAEYFLKKHRIPFDCINYNPDFQTDSPKMYADVLVDDRAINVSDIDDLLSADVPEWRGK